MAGCVSSAAFEILSWRGFQGRAQWRGFLSFIAQVAASLHGIQNEQEGAASAVYPSAVKPFAREDHVFSDSAKGNCVPAFQLPPATVDSED